MTAEPADGNAADKGRKDEAEDAAAIAAAIEAARLEAEARATATPAKPDVPAPLPAAAEPFRQVLVLHPLSDLFYYHALREHEGSPTEAIAARKKEARWLYRLATLADYAFVGTGMVLLIRVLWWVVDKSLS